MGNNDWVGKREMFFLLSLYNNNIINGRVSDRVYDQRQGSAACSNNIKKSFYIYTDEILRVRKNMPNSGDFFKN